MKKLVIGLFIIGLTSLGFSQNKKGEIKEVKLNDVLITTVNIGYLEKVQDKELSDFASLLQNQAATFNVSSTSKFDGRKEPFTTIFRGSKGYLIATYDNKGKILNTTERYRDIKLPIYIGRSVISQYPDYKLLKVAYSVDYDHQNEVNKTYKIQIMTNNTKTNLKISSGGHLNKVVTISMDN